MFIILPETNIATENEWLEDDISYYEGLLSVYFVSFREGNGPVSNHVSLLEITHSNTRGTLTNRYDKLWALMENVDNSGWNYG